jgi:predicted ATPase
MIHLRSLTLPAANRGSGFPFSVPAISTLTEIEFKTPVTFFVGENGSGKSTLLESIAIATNLLPACRQGALEHVRLTREFLADPDRFLRRL